MRTKPNPARQSIIDQAFKKLDRDRNGVITTKELKLVYDCSNNIKVFLKL